MFSQAITPTPHIACQPGWCLQYVRQTFGLPARYDSATEAWTKSKSQHPDRNFPSGVWLPVWYGLDNEPAGHVVLRAPDGSVYSTSDLKNTPHHHPNLEDLEAYYAYYGMPLSYRGWTEDVAGYPVLNSDGIAAMGDVVVPGASPATTPQSAPTAKKAGKMLFLVQTPGSTAIWIGDGITRRQVPDLQTLRDIQYRGSTGEMSLANKGQVIVGNVNLAGQPV